MSGDSLGGNYDEMPLANLSNWIKDNIDGITALTAIDKFPGGQSNPTYKISCQMEGAGAKQFVLRRKPFGPLLPSAHAVDREYKLISALHPTGFPVATPYALCEDADIVGSMFYVMDYVDGRSISDGQVHGVSNTDRKAMYFSMIDTLAQLHNTNVTAVGLGEYGAKGNYFERQVRRWTKQYRASQTDEIEEVENLIEYLSNTIPEQKRTSIIHGDYRIDNTMFDKTEPKIAAVLDWELSTTGDPMADFTYFIMQWDMPQSPGSAGLKGVDLEALGIPSMEETVRRYCDQTGQDAVPDLNWYFSYNLFRLVGILQGIKKRFLQGNASNAKAEAAGKRVIPLAKASWQYAKNAGA